MKPRIKLFALGGTISAHHELRDELRHYQTGHYTAQQLVDALPELSAHAEISIEQIDNITSTAVTYQHWLDLKQRLEQSFAQGFAGAVITHGTNTLEETAYFLHLTLASDKPVVLTGSQRPFSALSSDAPLNLLNAVRTAAAPQCHGLGVLVAMNDNIYSARDVSKTHSYHLESFQALNNGPLGSIDTDRSVRIDHLPARKHSLNSIFSQLPLNNHEPYVPILFSHAGADARLLQSLLKYERPKGIVLAGTGAGRCSPLEEIAIEQARKLDIPIVMSSRLASGRILDLDCYADLQLIAADDLPPQKARILLMLAINAGFDLAQLRQAFAEH
ncbi:MAG: asparaginase [Thiopseudomonas sp.]|nr:asparaginase [Thiopseudomonas sp.]MCK9465295.1 asparaginase [Thiopseudomonas sp.]